MKEQISDYLLNKFINGDCTYEEEEIVLNWFNSPAENDFLSSIPDFQREALRDRIYSRVKDNIGHSETDIREKSNIRPLIYVLSGVAAVLLIAISFVLFKNTRGNHANPNLSADIITITNNTKGITEQVLKDGSHVWLNPGAQIKFNKVFAKTSRDISLYGDSFFEITKNPGRPFIVHCENLTVKVWGTSFRVRNSKSSSFADVAVVTGKVSVKLSNNSRQQNALKEVMIYPDQQVMYVKNTNAFSTSNNTHIKELNMWKKINLSFDNTPLKQVISVLNKNFGVHITTVDDTLDGAMLNADFNSLNFPQIMEILHKILNVDYEINSTEVILKKNQI